MDKKYISQVKVDDTIYNIKDNEAARIISPEFEGIPKAPTPLNNSVTTQIATIGYVNDAFKANDAMIFKGTIGPSGATVTTLPAKHEQGWTYKVNKEGTYIGQNCEPGDMIICITDGDSTNDNHWTIVQNNMTYGGLPSNLDLSASTGISTMVARADHVHKKPDLGNITYEGKISVTTEIANGDKILISDSSDNNIIKNSSINFDGSSEDKALTPKGTWSDFYTEPEIDEKLNDKADNIIKNISGNPVIITDGSIAPVNDLTVEIKPIQDLHGLNNPYPAGGGKNLLKMTVDEIKAINDAGTWTGNSYLNYGVTFTLQLDNDGNVIGITATGISTNNNCDIRILIPSDVERELIVSGGPTTDAEAYIYCYDTTNNRRVNDWDGNATGSSKNGSTINIKPTLNSVSQLRCRVISASEVNNLLYKPMARLRTITDDTFEPSTNICPISGWTGCNIVKSRVFTPNQFVNNGNFQSTSGWAALRSTIYIENNTIKIQGKNDGSTSNGMYQNQKSYTAHAIGHVFFATCDAKADVTNIKFSIGLDYGSTADNVVYPLSFLSTSWQTYNGIIKFVEPTNPNYGFGFRFICTQNKIPDDSYAYVRNVMIIDLTEMFGEQVAEQILVMEQAKPGSGIAVIKGFFPNEYYETNQAISPENDGQGSLYSITFPTEIGTIYGGLLDVTTGVLTVTMVSKMITSCLRLTTTSSASARAVIIENANSVVDDWSKIDTVKSSYLPTISEQSSKMDEVTGIANHTNKVIVCKIVGMTSKEDYDAYLSANPLQVVYELVTPQTYQLTSTEITTLLGENIISADTDNINVSYRADTKTYIDNIVKSTTDNSNNNIQSMITQSFENDIATKNYNIGDLLIVNNQLLRVTTPINIGASISGKTSVVDLETIIGEKLDSYELPVASNDTLGGIKVGQNLTIDDTGKLSSHESGIIKTTSGNPVIISDGVYASVRDLTVEIEPVQDLHGYEHPYPAGGGKNLFHGIIYQEGKIIDTTTGEIVNNSAYNVYKIINIKNSSYTLSIEDSNTSNNKNVKIASYDSSDTKIELSNVAYTDASSTRISVSIPANTNASYILVACRTTTFNIMVEEGSVATTYEPYENICPISGWTGCNIIRSGKNFIESVPVTVERHGVTAVVNNDGTITLNGICDTAQVIIFNLADSSAGNGRQCDNKKHLPNGIYQKMPAGRDVGWYLQIIGTNTENPGSKDPITTISGVSANIFTIDDTYKYNYIRLYIYENATFDNETIYPWVYKMDEVTEYPITFPTEVGTVYGGSLDVTTGVLTVTHEKYEAQNLESILNKTWTKSASATNAFWITATGITNKNTKFSSSHFEYTNQTSTYQGNYGYCYHDSSLAFNCDPAICGTTVESWKAWLTAQKTLGTPVEVVVELVTPLTYQLTPTEIMTLLGNNTISADIGVVNITYRADIKTYIDENNNKKQNILTFDTIPTANSINPVTSDGIKTALDTKQNTLTFDTIPTTNSTNPVTSGGVKTALNNKNNYGYCTTAGATAEKEVEIEGFELITGVTIHVKFEYSNSAANPTLNVNNTGAKPIYRYGTTAPSGSSSGQNGIWAAKAILTLTYDGTGWIEHFWHNTTYTLYGAYCTTAAATAAKAATCTYYMLQKGYLEITMRYENTYAGAITLNIASKGVKPIWIDGQPSSDTNYTLPAGVYIIYYDGENYYFDTTGKIPHNIIVPTDKATIQWNESDESLDFIFT